MIKILRNKLLVALAALTLAAALPAAAQPPGAGFGPPAQGEPGFGPPVQGEHGGIAGHLRALAAFLELTPEQQDATAVLLGDLRATTEPLRDQLRILEDDLRALLGQPAPDATAVGQTVLAIHDLRQQIAAAREAFEEDFTALLTPEQVVRYEAFQAAVQALRRHGMRGGHRSGGPGPGGPRG